MSHKCQGSNVACSFEQALRELFANNLTLASYNLGGASVSGEPNKAYFRIVVFSWPQQYGI